jgi:hypothetical protein
MDRPAAHTLTTLRMLRHHLYEYGKGVRLLFMMTMDRHDLPAVVTHLTDAGVEAHVHDVNALKVNVFFGRPALVETVRLIVDRPLAALTAEEDFILGTLLGYDREQQCQRYLDRRRGLINDLPFAAAE